MLREMIFDIIYLHDDAGKGHFRLLPTHTEAVGDLTVSSLGVGTYLGPETDTADTEYVEAMTKALAVGINVLDTYVISNPSIDLAHVRLHWIFWLAITVSKPVKDHTEISWF